MITREILITTIENESGEEYEIAGRYDAVAIAHKGHKIIGSEFRKYRMNEETFIKNGELIEERKRK